MDYTHLTDWADLRAPLTGVDKLDSLLVLGVGLPGLDGVGVSCEREEGLLEDKLVDRTNYITDGLRFCMIAVWTFLIKIKY